MKKYKELVHKYAAKIAAVKAAKAAADKALQTFNKDKSSEELYLQWEKAHDQYLILDAHLSHLVEQEYDSVPFDEPREKGIEQFWKSAGIDH